MYQEDPKAVKQKIVALHKLKVKEIMRKEVVTVDEDTALYESLSAIGFKNINFDI